MHKIVHIVNPVKLPPSSDLYVAQPITFESMRLAKAFAKETVKVSLASVQYEEDKEIIPNYITQIANLERSILDLANFQKKRKLPLIQDIINAAIQEYPDSDYYIYTNVDISLMPHFYVSINQLLQEKGLSIAINRQTITDKYKKITDMPLLYTQIGKPHEGIDCFVFSNKVAKKMQFFNSFIGSGPVGMAFAINLIGLSDQFLWLEKSDLTFHLGDDKKWQNSSLQDYSVYNYEEVIKICDFYLAHNKDQNTNLLFSILKKQFRQYQNNQLVQYNIHKLLSLYCKDKSNFYKNAHKAKNGFRPLARLRRIFNK